MEEVLKLDLTHNLCPGKTWAEIRFASSSILKDAKEKIARHTGSRPDFIQLRAFTRDNQDRGPLLGEEKTLAELGVESGWRLEVTDTDKNSVLLDIENDTGARFKLSEEQYNARQGTAREFLSKLKAQRPELFEKMNTPADVRPSDDDIEAAFVKFPVGARCQVADTSLRGLVAWVGLPTKKTLNAKQLPADQVIIGVRLDEPLGSFNGVDGETLLFTCDCERQGLLIPAGDCRVGNYPPLDPMALDEI